MQTYARRTVALAVLTAALAVAGCAASEGAAEPAAAPVPTSAVPATLTVKDPWVKAADKGMTAAFGTVVNGTGKDVTVVKVSSPLSPVELHEMAMEDGEMLMREKAGGFAIKAGGSHQLAPGGDHLMLMEPSAPIKPGDEVSFTLTLDDGSTVPFTAVAKPFAGAGESYAPGHGAPSMAGM